LRVAGCGFDQITTFRGDFNLAHEYLAGPPVFVLDKRQHAAFPEILQHRLYKVEMDIVLKAHQHSSEHHIVEAMLLALLIPRNELQDYAPHSPIEL
jgi:hypothetical protein